MKRQVGALLAGLSLLIVSAISEFRPLHTASLKDIANVSYAAENPSLLASIFSPRMDFDQWKPLTGRGDPLRNDPTYDYEPPVLERVHYWADDTRLEREHYPERKSEVLMLGVSSRKPSVAPRQPVPPRRHHRPPPPKYEDYSYKISDHYPMTILVPPPRPPPGHKPSLFILDDKQVSPSFQITITDPPKFVKHTTSAPERLTTYALQESNLIYQSSTTSQKWVFDRNQTQSLPNSTVSSDYAGWGPTTPIDEIEVANDTHNLIFSDNIELSKQPYSFYKPMLSEAPPPPRVTANPLLLPTFIPTALPTFIPTALPPVPSPAEHTSTDAPQPTWISEHTTTESSTNIFDYFNEETTTEKVIKLLQTTPPDYTKLQSTKTLLDMMSPMMTMPLVNGPERLEDNLYAHASENLHVFKEHDVEDKMKLETMQTMQPPPVASHSETTTSSHKLPYHMSTRTQNVSPHKKPSAYTHDPYLNMRFSTPMPTVAVSVHNTENTKSTTEAPTVSTYLIIQGHSKVKTYGSKPKTIDEIDNINNEITKPNETNEVKHLHPLKEKYSSQKSGREDVSRRSRAQNLKSLVDEGRGSIEIQETDIGIKYDVSDGSGVPLEIYKKGIVDNEDIVNYSKSKDAKKENRVKRQIGLDDILPFDEDKLEEYVYNFLKGRKNETGITGLIAQAVTGSAGALLDDLEDDDGDGDGDDEQR